MDIPIYNGRNSWKKYKSQDKYRVSCSGFCKKARQYILSRDGEKCGRCGTKDNLTIDHIISSWLGFKYGIDIKKINHVDNLQVLCNRCNSWKAPEHSIDFRGEEPVLLDHMAIRFERISNG